MDLMCFLIVFVLCNTLSEAKGLTEDVIYENNDFFNNSTSKQSSFDYQNDSPQDSRVPYSAKDEKSRVAYPAKDEKSRAAAKDAENRAADPSEDEETMNELSAKSPSLAPLFKMIYCWWNKLNCDNDQDNFDSMPEGCLPQENSLGRSFPMGNSPPAPSTSENVLPPNIPVDSYPPQYMYPEYMPPANMPPANMPPANMPQANMLQAGMPQASMPQANMPQANLIQGSMPQGNMPPGNYLPQYGNGYGNGPYDSMPQQYPPRNYLQGVVPPQNAQPQYSVPPHSQNTPDNMSLRSLLPSMFPGKGVPNSNDCRPIYPASCRPINPGACPLLYPDHCKPKFPEGCSPENFDPFSRTHCPPI